MDEISSPNLFVYRFFKQSYRGGRVEIFKEYAEHRSDNFGIGYVDFTSLYPAICLNHTFPAGFYTEVNGQSNYNAHCYGIYLCKVIFQKENVLPFLSVKLNGKNVYPLGRWIGIYTSIEIEKARELDYNIEIISGFYF